MSMELFLGSLSVLTLAAIVVVSMTSPGRTSYPDDNGDDRRLKSKADPPAKDR